MTPTKLEITLSPDRVHDIIVSFLEDGLLMGEFDIENNFEELSVRVVMKDQ